MSLCMYTWPSFNFMHACNEKIIDNLDFRDFFSHTNRFFKYFSSPKKICRRPILYKIFKSTEFEVLQGQDLPIAPCACPCLGMIRFILSFGLCRMDPKLNYALFQEKNISGLFS